MQKKKSYIMFIMFIVGIHLFGILCIIYKQNTYAQLVYEKQKEEKKYRLLCEKKERLTHQLCALKNPSAIKRFARQSLALKAMNPSQIKHIKADG